MKDILTAEEREFVTGARYRAMESTTTGISLLAIIDRLVALLKAETARADGMERAGAEQARRADENREWALGKQSPSPEEIEAIRERKRRDDEPQEQVGPRRILEWVLELNDDRDTLLRALSVAERERDEARKAKDEYQSAYHAKWRQLDEAEDELAALRAMKARLESDKFAYDYRMYSATPSYAVDAYRRAVLEGGKP